MKLKKWLLGLITFAAMVVICAVCAGAETYGDFWYNVLDDGTVEISGYNGSAEKVDIPEKIDGKSVTRIGHDAFKYSPHLISITIPNSVTSIGSYAFYFCTGLRSVTIPDSVTEICDYTFEYCTSLKSITIPDSVTSIYSYAFSNCSSLTSITIPNSVKEIGSRAFRSCTSLTAINVTTGNKNYLSVNGVLYNKDKTAIICYPAGKKDKNYSILDSVTKIDGYAFEGCTSLKTVTIPDGVTYINYGTFMNCTSLTSITIPDSVTGIGSSAFGSCTSLTAINVTTGNKNYLSVNGVLYNKDKTAIICYPAGKKDKNYKIPDGVTSIGSSAFYGCTSLTSITIPDSVTYISDDVFRDCSSLTSITIPDSVTSIRDSTFEGCTSLTSIAIPDSVTEIGWYVFSDCSSLTSIAIPDSVTKIGWYVFEGCTSLTSITIPDSVTSIGLYTFRGCKSLTAINVATGNQNYVSVNGVLYNKNKTTIMRYPAGKKDKNYRISNGVTCIGGDAFESCTSLTSITIPNSVMEIGGWYAFQGCTSLKNVTIPNSVGYIGDCAFADCTSLTSITIPGSVTYIGDRAFGYYYDNGYKKIDNFKIYCYSNTAGEQYVKYNGFTYELLDKPTIATVTGFKVKSKTNVSANLQWNKNRSADGYILDKYDGKKWVTIKTFTSNANTSFNVTGLKASKTFKFRLRAYKNFGSAKEYSAYSYLNVNTRPYTTTGMKCSSKTNVSANLQWNKNISADGYVLDKYDGSKWVTIKTFTSNADTSFNVTGLKASTTFKFRLRAYKNFGSVKEYSAFTYLNVNTRPYTTTGMKCSSKTNVSANLQWNKNRSADGYILDKYDGSKWVTIKTFTSNADTSFNVTGLKASTTFKFRLRAYKNFGSAKEYSAYTYLNVNTRPYTTTGFKMKSATKNTITLQWNKNVSASGYCIEKWDGSKWVQIKRYTSNANVTYTATGLKANTAYKFRIRAYKTIGNVNEYSAYSAVVTARTKK